MISLLLIMTLFNCSFLTLFCVVFQVQAVELKVAYRLDPEITSLIQCLLALLLLPAREIPSTFSATLGNETKTIIDYFVGVWISTRSCQATWEPKQWSQYKQAIRANNDSKRLHRCLNTWAGHASLSFYHLLELLHHDSRFQTIQLSLLISNAVIADQHMPTLANWMGYGIVTPLVSTMGCSFSNTAGKCNTLQCNGCTLCKHGQGPTEMELQSCWLHCDHQLHLSLSQWPTQVEAVTTKW